ncbi:MAG: hypothetical protein WAW37_06670 [Syntrophobacteraceae bacterium]
MTKSFIFVYLAHGGRQFRKGAVLSISSLLATGPVPGDIVVFTDRPGDFEGLPVEIAPLTKALLKKWKGPYGFTHRVKIELIRDVLEKYGKSVIFMDSDTFWTESPAGICRFLDEGFPVLHEREAVLSETYFPEYLAVVRDREKLAGAGLSPADLKELWVHNAGVIGIPRAMDPDILEQVARFCDFMSRDVPRLMEWSEQLAFSYTFHSLGLEIKAADGCVFHYWRDSFEFMRQIGRFSNRMLFDLGRDTERIFKLIEVGRSTRRSLGNQVLVRTRRLGRSLRKRRRELLVFLDILKLKFPRDKFHIRKFFAGFRS